VLPHLAQPDALPLARVAALCGRTLERVQALAQLYHVPHVTVDYGNLLADRAVEAVLVLSPARLHFTQALAAVRAGKHVYVQKPMTETLQEALILEREVARQGVCLVAAPGQTLNPLLPRLREVIQSGVLGAPFWAQAPAPSWGGREVKSGTNPAWYFREGAGPFRDRAVYALHLLLELFGPVRRVCAMQSVTVKRRSWAGRPFIVTAADNVVAQLEFDDGLLATVGAHWCAAGPRAQPFQLGIYCLEGAIESRGYLETWPASFEVMRADGQSGTLALDPGELPALTAPHLSLTPHIWADLHHLLSCIREGREPVCGAEPARQVIEVIEAVERAAETGQTQELVRSV
jgi:predicted dehydrogenase